MSTVRVSLVAMVMLGGAPVTADAGNPWSEFTRPSAGEARAIGKYQAGCLRGADTLEVDETGIELMRPQRRRHFGHPALTRSLRDIAGQLARAGHGSMLVGDLSMPRGGPTLSGHVSHQSGLDADVWFRVLPASGEGAKRLSLKARRTMPAPGYVDFSRGELSARWGPPQDALVRFAATSAQVERVLVNAAIKRHFCNTVTGDRVWLRKLRPWWGHADHMHIRLRCPPDSPGCTAQEPPPPGDGCDASLDWWFTQAAADALAERRKKAKGRVMPELPAECSELARMPDG